MPVAIEFPPLRGTARPPRIGVIDIGSNSIRLVVYDALSRAPVPLLNEKVLCALGRTLEKTGRLNPEGISIALANLRRFKHLAEAMEVARLLVLATAAVRDAADGAAFAAEVKRQVGLEVEIISGEEEARQSALGVLSGTPGAHGLMGDLGGGSLELVRLDRGAIAEQATTPLGPLRLADASEGRLSAAARLVDRYLESLPWLGQVQGATFYPVGGSWRALAKLHMEQERHPLHIIHHYTIDAAAARDFAALIAHQSRSSLERSRSVSRRRIETLPYAALVMERVLRIAQPARITFSAYGLREGLLFDLLSPEQQRQDPLISACTGLAERLGRFGAGEIMAAWTAPLFVGEDAAAARLRMAACLLSDLGWAEHPDYRADHAFLRVLRLAVAGIDHDERAFLALATHARYGGSQDCPVAAVARRLLSEGQVAKAHILGLALRLAHTLTGGVASLLQRTSLRLDAEKLVLALSEDTAQLAGEAVLRRLEALARALSRTGEVAVVPRPTPVPV